MTDEHPQDPPPAGYPVYAATGQPVPYGYPPQQQPNGYPVYPMYPPPYVLVQPDSRPGSLVAGGVLGYVQAGITAIPTIMLTFALTNMTRHVARIELLWTADILQFVGIFLLILGSTQMVMATSRAVFIAGVLLEIGLTVYWAVCFGVLFEDAASWWSMVGSQLIVFSLLFGILPVIGLILAVVAEPVRRAPRAV
jgi:hypothetical protein